VLVYVSLYLSVADYSRSSQVMCFCIFFLMSLCFFYNGGAGGWRWRALAMEEENLKAGAGAEFVNCKTQSS
jgi:hypothetical protein